MMHGPRSPGNDQGERREAAAAGVRFVSERICRLRLAPLCGLASSFQPQLAVVSFSRLVASADIQVAKGSLATTENSDAAS